MHPLEIRSLSMRFGGLRALEDVSIRIKGNSITAIIGPNGAGKTTLFNCLTGLVSPTSGKVYFKGNDITGLAPHRISRLGLSRTFQNIRLFKAMSVMENVMTGMHARSSQSFMGQLLRSKPFKEDEARMRQRAVEYLGLAGVEDSYDMPAGSLPYGAQRRLEIARALASEPEVLLLDEPTAGMNPSETGDMMLLIRRLRGLGMAVVFIEHDMRFVMGVSDAISVLDHGVKIAEGAPSEIKENPLVIEAYLGRDVHA